ncbi:Stk1 family PASTA domain-containing Ser/Thr kinase [Clostridium tyrobutyricum]|uniref:Stk1 family PASTA domain-containing Ser/Thr kinase n=1 Tax=Clostridium tyrobutyricum TaxID=1519 RepID=UPI002B212CA4|nr:Stk1 family PASTA domain-containing Ser/Thr kinase [Clostridium tyrobutyricum]MEA5007877.1 Stk1 family PASTA domain-containing Ser/Thr kinase [Clostridium tyrobutyricum]
MIGTTLGNRYEVLEKIGEGGMAIVYKGKDKLLNRNVAVKILKEEFSSDTEFVKKFKREATAAASLSNNHIVNIYDVGSDNDINYIIMEYVSGKTLKQVIKENGKLAPNKAVELSIQIVKALECAHKNNIIHRDIKPHNILVTDDGTAKVTDFGIAKASNSVTITNSNRIMGSAHYFSPEQAKGSFVDFRTDIYSLGIVMYEMVTGRVPYDADSPVSVALKHIQEPVVPPKELDENIPDSLNKLILKAVEKEPIRRYQTMTAMLLDLNKIQNNQNPNIVDDDFEEDMTRIMDPADVNNAISAANNQNDKNNDNDDDEEELEDSVPSKKNILDPKKKRNILLAALAVLIVVIGFIVGYNKIYSGVAETTVPNIVGMKQSDAKSTVEAKKLKFVVAGKENSDKPKGTVIKVLPKAGTKVKVNSEVRVSISGGKKQLTVPNVVGTDLDTAKDIITKSGLNVGDISYKYSDNVSSGDVISQDPQSDSNVDDNSSIDLIVSNGPEIKYATVPDVTGRNIDEATSILENAGFKVAPSQVDTPDSSLAGKVSSQSAVGSQKQGSTITVSYYKYVEAASSNDQNDNGDKSGSQQGSGSSSSGGSQQGSGSNSSGGSQQGSGSSSDGSQQGSGSSSSGGSQQGSGSGSQQGSGSSNSGGSQQGSGSSSGSGSHNKN